MSGSNYSSGEVVKYIRIHISLGGNRMLVEADIPTVHFVHFVYFEKGKLVGREVLTVA